MLLKERPRFKRMAWKIKRDYMSHRQSSRRCLRKGFAVSRMFDFVNPY